MDWLTGGLGLVGGLISNIWTDQRQSSAQAFAAAQARQQMEFQERMSNTQYQRGMADMRAAGLNPILAYQRGGASSPAGAAGTTSHHPASDPITPALSSARASERLKQELQNMIATNDNIMADTRKKISEGNVADATEKQIGAQTNITVAMLERAIAEAAKAKTDKEFFESPIGRILRMLGLGGRELSSAIAPVTSAVSAARGGVQLGGEISNFPYGRWP